jgi:hypothetical protein
MSFDLFADAPERPGGLACRIEIAATMAEALRVAGKQGLQREVVVKRMAFHLGDKLNPDTLNNYTSESRAEQGDEHTASARDISLLRAMAFDAAIGSDVLLSLYARKRGERRVVTADEAAFIELGRIHHQERALAERKRALQTLLKTGGKA